MSPVLLSRKTAWTIAQAFVSVLLLVLLFRGFDWLRFWRVCLGIPAWFYFFALASVFLGQILFCFRWYLVTRAMSIKLPFSRLFQYYLIGIFFNNFLPTAIGGDGARVYYLGKEEGYIRIGGSVFLERFLGFFAIVGFAVLMAWRLKIGTPAFAVARNVLTVCLALMAMALVSLYAFPVERAGRWISSLGGRLEGVGKRFQETISDIKAVTAIRWLFIALAAMVFVYFFLFTIVYGMYFRLVLGTAPSCWGTMTVLLSIAILCNIPVTVNGIGLREQLHYLLFAALGIPKEAAVSISLLIFADLLIVSVLGYFFWMRQKAVYADK